MLANVAAEEEVLADVATIRRGKHRDGNLLLSTRTPCQQGRQQQHRQQEGQPPSAGAGARHAAVLPHATPRAC